MNDRIVWIDWMKAILILLVVLGHSGSVFTYVIYLFHIPAFFFISGYLANYDKADAGSLKSSKWMIYAIIVYNLLLIGIHIIHATVTGTGIAHANPGTDVNELLLRPLMGITWCYYQDNPLTNPVCAQFWFVWVLIIMKWLYRFLAHHSDVQKIVVCALCIVYSGIIYQTGVNTLFYIDRSILAFPFFVAGNMLRGDRLPYLIKSVGRNRYLWVSFLLLVVIVAANIFINKHCPDIFHYMLGNSVLSFYIIAFIGICAVVLFCQLLPSFRIIEIVSNGTFLILAAHLYLLEWTKKIPFVVTDPTKLVALLIICSLCYPMIIWGNRYAPILLGKSSNKNSKKKI